MEFNRDKLKALIHYVCDKVDDPFQLGAIKLNKILWLSDILAYLVIAEPITGERYIKRQYGPVPSHILVALKELQAEGLIKIKDVEFHGFKKKEFLALESADATSFNTYELDIINDVIDDVCNNHTAKSISDFSHNDLWEMAMIGEEIPYEATFAVKMGELNESDIEWARGVLDKAA